MMMMENGDKVIFLNKESEKTRIAQPSNSLGSVVGFNGAFYPDQLWTVQAHGDGSYYLLNAERPNYRIGLKKTGDHNHELICSNQVEDNQRWTFHQRGDFYKIESALYPDQRIFFPSNTKKLSFAGGELNDNQSWMIVSKNNIIATYGNDPETAYRNMSSTHLPHFAIILGLKVAFDITPQKIAAVYHKAEPSADPLPFFKQVFHELFHYLMEDLAHILKELKILLHVALDVLKNIYHEVANVVHKLYKIAKDIFEMAEHEIAEAFKKIGYVLEDISHFIDHLKDDVKGIWKQVFV